MASPYTVRKVGQPYTLDHRVYIEKDGVPISPFHDIPLYANPEGTILNMIVEIPRWTNAKLEVRAWQKYLRQFLIAFLAIDRQLICVSVFWGLLFCTIAVISQIRFIPLPCSGTFEQVLTSPDFIDLQG